MVGRKVEINQEEIGEFIVHVGANSDTKKRLRPIRLALKVYLLIKYNYYNLIQFYSSMVIQNTNHFFKCF